MATVSVYNMDGQNVGTMDLNDAVFAAPVKENLVHQAVVQHLANKRQGTQKAKTRAEVSGGGIKPWRQKGTGRARQGSTRSPQWRHGGVVFAPKPRDYTVRVNRKVKRIAMKSALSGKVQDSELIVLKDLDLQEAKTKEMVKVLDAVKAEKALIVLPESNESVERAARNIEGVKTALVGTLNVYEILKHKSLVLTEASVKKIEEVYV